MGDINLFNLKGSIYLKKVKSKEGIFGDDSCDGYLIGATEKEARRIVDSLKGSDKKIGIVGGDDAFNRRIVETLRIDYLISPERGTKSDTLKQRDSGINHVVAKIAKEKNILVVVDMSEVGKLNGKEKALRLGRIIQNVKVCRKAGCRIGIASLGLSESEVIDEKGRKAFGTSLGMSSKQIAESVEF
ncbi:MAG: hypothetical protein V1889_00150 [archaeon]